MQVFCLPLRQCLQRACHVQISTIFVSGYKKVCYANSQSKILRQGFVSRYVCVKFKFKTALATSFHLKITVNIFIHTNIGFKKSLKKLKRAKFLQLRRTVWKALSSKACKIQHNCWLSCNQIGQKVIYIELNPQPVTSHVSSPGI